MKQLRTKTTRSAGRLARHPSMFLAAAFVALLLLWGYPNHAQIGLAPGELDPAFGTSGIVVTQCPGEDAMVQAVAVQPDGKIVAAGFIESGATPTALVLARYNPNGTLDATFGANGMVTNEHFAAFGVSIQPDGKLVLAGLSNARQGRFSFSLWPGSTATAMSIPALVPAARFLQTLGASQSWMPLAPRLPRSYCRTAK